MSFPLEGFQILSNVIHPSFSFCLLIFQTDGHTQDLQSLHLSRASFKLTDI